jgi:ClpP class serine protease
MGGINAAKLVPIRREIEDQIDAPRDEVEVDLWIESGGGAAHPPDKLALQLRYLAAHLRVVVPD